MKAQHALFLISDKSDIASAMEKIGPQRIIALHRMGGSLADMPSYELWYWEEESPASDVPKSLADKTNQWLGAIQAAKEASFAHAKPLWKPEKKVEPVEAVAEKFGLELGQERTPADWEALKRHLVADYHKMVGVEPEVLGSLDHTQCSPDIHECDHDKAYCDVHRGGAGCNLAKDSGEVEKAPELCGTCRWWREGVWTPEYLTEQGIIQGVCYLEQTPMDKQNTDFCSHWRK